MELKVYQIWNLGFKVLVVGGEDEGASMTRWVWMWWEVADKLSLLLLLGNEWDQVEMEKKIIIKNLIVRKKKKKGQNGSTKRKRRWQNSVSKELKNKLFCLNYAK